MGGEKFLVGLRGAKNFSIAFRIVFRILFRVFQTVFSYRFKKFSGANSFCTRAALTSTEERSEKRGCCIAFSDKGSLLVETKPTQAKT